MKPVQISNAVILRLDELYQYIVDEYKMPDTAHKRIEDIHEFLQSLGGCYVLSKCRHKKWSRLGYRCAVFDHVWIFAYQVYDDRIIIHDMEHAANIK